MRLIEGDTRAISGYMNFQKDQTGKVDPYVYRGPTAMGERLWPVVVEGKRIGFSHIAPKDMD